MYEHDLAALDARVNARAKQMTDEQYEANRAKERAKSEAAGKRLHESVLELAGIMGITVSR